MARTQGSDDLFRLIRSLSKTEVSFFRLYASRHISDGSQYLKLFNAINAQEKFEEASLKKEFKTYPVIKNQLFEMVLKSLLVSDEKINKMQQLILQLVSGISLAKRGLDEKALRLLEKGLAETRKNELFMLEGAFLRKIFEYRWPAKRRNDKKLISIFTELRRANERQQLIDDYTKERFKANAFLNKITFQKPVTPAEHPDVQLLLDDKQDKSSTAKRLRYGALLTYYKATNQLGKAYTFSKKLFILEDNIIKKDPDAPHINFVIAQRFHTDICVHSGRYKEAWRLLNYKSANYKAEQNWLGHIQVITGKSGVLWCTGQHDRGLDFLQLHEELLERQRLPGQFDTSISQLKKFRLLFQFSTGKFRDAILFIHSYQAEQGEYMNMAYFKDCEILKILIQVDSGNLNLLQSLTRNAIRRSSQLKLSGEELKFLKLIKKLDEKNSTYIFEEINALWPAGQGPELFSVFYLSDWVSSKMRNVPLSQVVKEYWQKEAKKFQD